MMELNRIYQGSALDLLQQLPGGFIDCIVTSPPYYGLRSYKGAETIWGRKECQHEWNKYEAQLMHENRQNLDGGTLDAKGTQQFKKQLHGMQKTPAGFCSKCGAWKGQLGLEPDYKLYLNHLLQITAELKRVLKPTGTLWWNMGDSYAGSKVGKIDKKVSDYVKDTQAGLRKLPQAGMPTKSLMQLPQRLAIRMADEQGFILRNIAIWHKPNHMPSSVKDRLSNSYEFIYFWVKSRKYYFNLDAIRVPTLIHENRPRGIVREKNYPNAKFNIRVRDAQRGHMDLKWGSLYKATPEEMAKYNEKKYAAAENPEALGSPRAREARLQLFNSTRNPRSLFDIENDPRWVSPKGKNPGDTIEASPQQGLKQVRSWSGVGGHDTTHNRKYSYNGDDFLTITTQPHSFAHFATYPEKLCELPIKSGCPEDGIVLDPFAGSGTTCLVAQKLHRKWLGFEIVQDYIGIANRRLEPYVKQGRIE